MPVSNSVIRRYTPPTCTLEVLAQNSALSRWMGKSVLKQLRFELRFDDPRLPEEQRITIRGDHNQLDALHTTITNYIQELLEQSPQDFWVSVSSPTELSNPSDASRSKSLENSANVDTKIPDFNAQMLRTEIQIEPSEHLTHNLLLGSLASQASAPIVKLSLLQLFDLATALDEYSADVLSLPNLSAERSASAFPAWAPVAAVLVLAAGLTPLTWQYAQNIREKQQTAKKSTPTSPQQKVALAPSPSQNSSTPYPPLTPPDSVLSQSQTPLSLLGSPLPPPPPASLGSIPTTTAQKIPKTSLPPASQTFPNLTLPKTTSSSSNLLTIPGSSQTLSSSKKIASLTPEKPNISLQPNLKDTSTTGLTSKKSTALLPGGIAASPLPTKSSPFLDNSRPSRSSPFLDNSRIPPSLGVIPDNSGIRGSRNSLNVQSDPSLERNDSLITKLRTNRKTATSVATGTLFDTAQVAEAREYFKKHWQPPAALKQTIEYSLLVGVDGTIEQIVPLGKAARDFVDRSGMPLIGEHFVSPNKNGQAVRIRAVLSPDGKVQTFPEAD
jgi:hypothetical protein